VVQQWLLRTNLNVNANIGDKLRLPINYNTLANFDFENQLKLDYKGMDDEILKSLDQYKLAFGSKSIFNFTISGLNYKKTTHL
jgi:cell surface protein SprA